jgi:hypothetical protein
LANADIKTKKITITLDATSGVHDQSFTGVGFQPKAGIFWGTLQTALETYNEGYSHSYGFSDGTTSCCIAGASVDNVATLDCSCMIRNDACIELLNTAAGNAEIVRAKVKTWDSDGFTLTYNAKTNTTQYILHVLLFSGADLSVKAKVETSGRNTTGTQGYTGYGFQPDIIFLAGVNNATQNTLTANMPYAIGAAKSSTVTFCYNCFETDNVSANTGAVECTGMWNNRTLVCQNTGSTGIFQFNVTLSTMDTDGYTLTHNNAAAATTFPFIVLAFKGGYWDLAHFTQRSGAGTTTFTGSVTQKPIGFIVVGQDLTTINSQSTTQNTDMGSSVGATDGTAEGYVLFGNSIINSPSRDAMFSSTDKIIRNATIAATATSSTTTSQADSDLSVNGQATLSYTAADAIARRCAYVLLQKDLVTGQNITKSLTETVAVSDASVRLAGKIRTTTETVTIGETPARLTTKQRALTNTVAITDSTVRVKGKVKTLSETVTIGGTVARLLTKARAITETVTTTGTLTRLAAKQRALADTVTTTGTVVKVKGSVKTLTNTISVSDSITRLVTKVRTIVQTVSTTGTLTRLAAKQRLISQTVSISETLSRTKGVIKTLTETVTTTGVLARLVAKTRAKVETVAVSDILARLAAKQRTLSQTISVSDLAITLKIRTVAKALTETVSVSSGSVTKTKSAVRAVSDTISIGAGSLTRLTSKLRAPNLQTITVSDSLSRVKNVTRQLSNNISVTEALTKLLSKSRAITQTVSIIDTLARNSAKLRTLIQTVSISDLVERLSSAAARNIVLSIVEARVVISDACFKARAITDFINISDFVGQTKTDNTPTDNFKTLTESVNTTAAVNRMSGKLRPLAESANISDLAAITRRDKVRVNTESVHVADLVGCQKSQRQISKSITETVTIAEAINRKADKIRKIGGGFCN